MGMSQRARILVLDDDRDTAELVVAALGSAGFDAACELRAEAALAKLESQHFDTLLTDLSLTDGLDGLDVCRHAIERFPGMPVVVVTAHSSLEAAISAMRAGAHDFITKPIDLDALVGALRRAVKHRALRAVGARGAAPLGDGHAFPTLVGNSGGMARVMDVVRRVSGTDATVLVTGESGTGKELVARAVHDASGRSEGPFVALNCSAVPSQLLESELFGHVRGAFTDARAARKGLFLEANGGTLFLDEIGEMPPEMQVKLLRALQERRVRPVGGTDEVEFDARIIAATNRNLDAEVASGRFREDLYYRINVVGVHVPPLRERPSDVALLASHFVRRFATRFAKTVTGVSPEVLEKLLAYDWPGNVRELENGIERAVALSGSDEITVDDLPARVRACASHVVPPSPESAGRLATLEEVERRHMLHVLSVLGSNKSAAARVLGIDRRTLYRRLAQLDVSLGAETDEVPRTGTHS